MAEIVGVVAAAAQLATYATNLGDIILRIKSSRVATAEYRRSLDHLHSIARSVERNPLLQTSEVEQVTKAIISTFLESPVRKVLFNVSKHRAIRAISAITVVLYQKQIEELFRSIEHEKTTLALFIAEIQSLHIYEIRSDIQAMSGFPPSPPPSDSGIAPSAPRLATMSDPRNSAGWGHQHGGYGEEYNRNSVRTRSHRHEGYDEEYNRNSPETWGHQHRGYGEGALMPAYGSQGPPRRQSEIINNQHVGHETLYDNYRPEEPTSDMMEHTDDMSELTDDNSEPTGDVVEYTGDMEEPMGDMVDRNVQEPQTARFDGQEIYGYGSNVWGHKQSRPRRPGEMPPEQSMANMHYANNVRHQPSYRDSRRLGCDTVLGAEFSGGAITERISGTWERNILKADGNVVLGTSTK